MSDTSSQNSPSRDTLQAEIAYQISPAGGRMTTFIIKDKTGNCTIPPYTNVRLINCNLQSLSVSNSSILYIFGGSLVTGQGNFNITNSAVIVEGVTKWNAPVTFTNSKVEFIGNCQIGATVTLNNSSYMKSIGNTWKGINSKIAIIATDNSRVDSSKDYWSSWGDYFWKVTSNSIIKIINASNIDHTGDAGGGLALVDGTSVVVLSHPVIPPITTNSNPLFNCTNGSRVELYNFPSLVADGVIFQLDSSRVIVRNVDSLTSNKDKIGNLTGSFIEFSNVPTFSSNSTKDMFTATDSVIFFNTAKSLKAKGIALNLTQTNIRFGGSDASIESTSNIAIQAVNSTLFMVNLSSIKSDAAGAISLDGSAFKGTNITNITSGYAGETITGKNSSYLTLTNVKTISGFGDSGILLQKSKASLLNVDTIKSQGGAGAGIKATTQSSVIGRNIGNVSGPEQGIFLDDYSTLIFKGNNTIVKGSTSGVSVGEGCRTNISNVDTISASQGNGIDNPGKHARIELKDVKTISGSAAGLSILGADLLLDNSGIGGATITGTTGIKLSSSENLGTYKAVIVGPLSVNAGVALDATNYQIEEQGVSWNGSVITTNCITKNTLSETSGNTTGVGSHSDQIRTVLGSLSLSKVSSMRLRGSSVNGSTSLDKSFMDLGASTANAATLTDSFLGAFFSKIGTVSLSGLSSALGGGSQGATLNFSGDEATSSPTAYLASTGTVGFQADNDVNMKTGNNIVFDSPNAIQYTGDADVVITVGGSSITVTPSSIVLIANSITENLA